MSFTTIILNILFLSVSIKEYQTNNKTKDSLEIKLTSSLDSKQAIDTLTSIKNKNNFYLLIKGVEDYDLVLTSIKREDYEDAKQSKTTQLLDETIIPSEVDLTEDCYTITTKMKTLQKCLGDEEQLISISYLGFISKLNTCVVNENWFESTTSNLLINLKDGTTSYISGYELIFSPDVKFIYSYANDGIDFDGISLHQIKDKKACPILITDYNTIKKYNFDFSSLGKAYWVSDNSFYTRKNNEYYKFKIQDKRITYSDEYKENIIHSENSKFTIKVDRLKNGTIRYTSWNKPNTTNDQPSLVLYNGEVEKQNKYGSGFDYRFKNKEYLYVIESNTEVASSKRVMLKLYRNREEKLYVNLTDLTKQNKKNNHVER